MLNIQHAVEMPASMDNFETDPPSFIIEMENNEICEANSKAIAGCKGLSPIGKKLSDVVFIEKSFGMAESPAYFNGQWFKAIQKTIMLNEVPHTKIKLKPRQRIPDFEVLESLKNMMGLLLHRVRSPLTGMQGYTGLAKDSLEEERSNARNYINKIDNGIDQLLNMLDKLERLQSLSMDSAGSNYSASPESVLSKILSKYSTEVRKRISVASQTKMNLLPCNPGDLQHILSILIENAVEYSEGDSKIMIDQPSKLSIRITHDGKPIPEQITERLFAPFITSQATKLGIGLTMAILYAKRYNGSIFLTRNNLFTGISFTVCFPPSNK